ncbi:MAG: 3-phosphoglycerate dehydrogenase [Thaumarchaeota archaeon]|nr:3-phosphoglycerate dehydrogenase [Nitrososphaerota archaeon]
MNMDEKVLVCDEIDQKGIEVMKKSGLQVDYKPEIKSDELVKLAKDYDILVVRSRTKITKEIIDANTKIKIIARVGVGLDNIDVDYAKSKNIQVINAAVAAMNAVAELVIGLMLSLARNIPINDAGIKNDKWLKKEFKGIELKGKYLGIVGVGKIGRRIGKIARGFGMNLIGYDVIPIDQQFTREVGLITTDLNTLLSSADFVTFHVSLTDDTRYMINEQTLKLMKKTAYIINTSRGAVIDEVALYKALKERKIAGVALDVFEVEPPTNNELVKLPNVICTPHIGAQTVEAQELAAIVIAEQIIQIVRQSEF